MQQVIDKLAWIHIKDRKILSTRSRGKDICYIPGGKRESGETDQEALTREIKEELTVDLVLDTLTPFGVFSAQAHGKAQGVVVQMTCYTADYVGIIAPASEIEEVLWLEHKDRLRSSPVDQIIFDWLRDHGMID
ncbi:MAG TPA: NUDIX domain-containing protein [Ktedonobacterales bacterium]|nr:NUDIX domain-containing protein [Ktedonobacterales bacterium]